MQVQLYVILIMWLVNDGPVMNSAMYAWYGLPVIMSGLLLSRHTRHGTLVVTVIAISSVALLHIWDFTPIAPTLFQSALLWTLRITTLVSLVLLIKMLVQRAVQFRDHLLFAHEQQINQLLHETNARLTAQVTLQTEELRLANAALAAREADLRQLIANLPAPIIVSHRDRILFVNRAAVQLLGLQSLDEALNRSIFDWVGVVDWPESDVQRDLIQQRIQLAESGKELPALELSFKDDDEQPIHLEIHSAPIHFENKLAVLSVLFDITARKVAEQALRDKQRFIEQMTMNIPAVILVVNEAEECVEANVFASTLLGYSYAELLQLPLAQLIVQNQPKTIRELATLAEAWPSAEPELSLKCKDGRSVPVIGRIVLNITAGQHLFVALDISERRAAEEQLRKSEEHFRTLVERSPAIIYRGEWTGNLRLTYITPNVQQLLGYTSQDLLQQSGLPDNAYHPEDVAPLLHAIEISRTSGVGQFEYRIRNKDGVYHWVLDQWGFLPASNECIGYMLDITDRKLMETALVRSRSELRKLATRLSAGYEEERARLAREVHDALGQNLTVLKIRIEYLLRELTAGDCQFTDMVRELNPVVDQTIEHVHQFIGQLRPVILDELGLTPAIEWLVHEFTDQTDLTVDLDLPGQMPDIERTLAISLYRIVQEALTNVVRHAKATHVQITLATTAQQVTLSIQDDGCGFNTNLAKSPKSLGIIGMRERIAPWNGLLRIESNPNQGTTVYVEAFLAPNSVSDE
jgi:PAS domain S-box-containing protein